MGEIKIIFFVLGTFFGINYSHIGSEKATVTIDPQAKTMVIHQENLCTIIKSEKDSLALSNEIDSILNKNWSPLFKNYKSKSIEFQLDNNNLLNAIITLEYTNSKQLKDFALDVNSKGNISLINIPNWNIETTDGQLKDNYWNFEANKKFTFSMKGIKNYNEKSDLQIKSISNLWEQHNKE